MNAIMKVPHIFINMHYFHIGGAESALISLLTSLCEKGYAIDLFVNSHEGPLMSRIPDKVNLLPEDGCWKYIERPLVSTVLSGNISLAISRLKAKLKHRRFVKDNPMPDGCTQDDSIFGFVGENVVGILPEIEPDKEYDLAISFMMPHDYVVEKVRARKYAAWIHTDYSKVRIDSGSQERVWDKYDYLIAVSDKTAWAFKNMFPALAAKVRVIENITPLDAESGGTLPDKKGGKAGIFSMGRFCDAKNFDIIPYVAKELRTRGLDFIWTIAGPGDSSSVAAEVARLGIDQYIKIKGAVNNPASELMNADVYVQPSKYEGKSVAVQEAKAMKVPVVLTPYPSASSQVDDGKTGLVAKSFSPSDIASAVEKLVKDKTFAGHIMAEAYADVVRDNERASSAMDALVSDAVRPERKQIPEIIHYCWFGGKSLPEEARRIISTWENKGFEVKRWDEENFPIDEYRYASDAYKAGNFAFVSDVCRVYALVNYGGVYLDTDVELVGNLTPFLQYDAFMGFEGTQNVATALIGARKNHPFFVELNEFYKKEKLGSCPVTNVRMITDRLINRGLELNGRTQTVADVTIFPAYVFSPFDYVDGRLHRTSRTVAIHWYSQYWIKGNPPLRRKLSVLYHRLRGIKLK